MNILLVKPSFLRDDGSIAKYNKILMPSLNLAMIAALTPASHNVRIVNDLVEDIDYTLKYDLVGITAMTLEVERAYQIAQKFREKGVKVVIAGIHATFSPSEARQYADSVVIGEAEELWEGILDDCENDNLKDFYKATDYPEIKECLPRWDKLNLNHYRNLPARKTPMFPIYATKGCPFGCKFCSVTRFFGRTYRFKPIDHVLNEVDHAQSKVFFFIDDNIIGNPDYSRELFKYVKKKNIKWISQASTTILKNPDLIDLAAESGCYELLLGVESIHTSNLDSVNKGFNRVEEYGELFARLKRAGINPFVSILFGFEYDTTETFQNTLDFLQRHKIQNPMFYLLTPLPGSALFDEFEKEGKLLHKNWSQYDGMHVVFKHKNFSEDDLDNLYWQTKEKFYSITNTIKRFAQNLASFQPLFKSLGSFMFQLTTREKILNKEGIYKGGF